MSDPFFAKLSDRFRLRARTDSNRLRAALDAGDSATLTAIAHALSGTAGTFGFAEIGSLAAALEEAVNTGVQLDTAAQRLFASLDAL